MPRCAIPPMCHPPKTPEVRAVRGLARRAPSYRFIPACAGNTQAAGHRTREGAVHPRVCGEHQVAGSLGFWLVGSSPRVRGTPAQVLSDDQPLRFIPACAGNTRRAQRIRGWPSVHPRVCGEHRQERAAELHGSGSSPRVRGTLGTLWLEPDSAAVHPRVCGEHRVIRICRTWPRGSSPRVRGTPACTACRRWRARFIPACAGNTTGASEKSTELGVHPRVCGEHLLRVTLFLVRRGSSPRVRGTPQRVAALSQEGRFIPACAGNTYTMKRRLGVSAVHPRVCGEHVLLHATSKQSRGSSPRVRGTLEIAVACQA